MGLNNQVFSKPYALGDGFDILVCDWAMPTIWLKSQTDFCDADRKKEQNEQD